MSLSTLSTTPTDPRDQEVRMLVELVRLSRVTVLLAEAGSDKSRVVRSTVVPLLQDRGASTKEVAVLLDWWEKVPLIVLNARIDEALASVVGDAAHAMGDHASTASLSERLAVRQQAFGCTFIIVLDRFEQYLAAPPDHPDVLEFEAQFVEAVNNKTLGANFLLSLDEHAAPLLARLRERIPGLGDARVRLPKIETETADLGGADASLRDQLVGSKATVDQRDTSKSDISHDAATSRQVEQGSSEESPSGETTVPMFLGADSQGQQYKNTASLANRVERGRAEHETRGTIAAPESGASILRASQKLQALDRDRRANREPVMTDRGAPVAPIADPSPEPSVQAVSEDAPLDARSRAMASADIAPSRSGTTKRLAVMFGIVIALLSSVAILSTRRGGEPAPDAATAPPRAAVPAQDNPKGNGEEPPQTGASAQAGASTPLKPEEASGSLKGNADNRIESAPESSAAAPKTEAAPLSSESAGRSDASPAPSVEQKPTASAPPPSQARTREEPAASTAGEPATPQLYIHVRNEAQRAYAERMIEPLARHGIRVSGIKVEAGGPPESDLRYFRSADRAEAVRINRALDVVGTPAQRLKYVGGGNEQGRRRQYELWLTPPT